MINNIELVRVFLNNISKENESIAQILKGTNCKLVKHSSSLGSVEFRLTSSSNKSGARIYLTKNSAKIKVGEQKFNYSGYWKVLVCEQNAQISI